MKEGHKEQQQQQRQRRTMLIGVRPFLREEGERGRKTSPFEQAGNTSRQLASKTHYTEQREREREKEFSSTSSYNVCPAAAAAVKAAK